MQNRSFVPAFAATLALTFAIVTAAPAAAEGPITVRLAGTGPSRISGIAVITTQGESTTLTIDVGGLTPNSSNPIYLHAGSCAQPSASFGNLGMLEADSGGKGTLTATSMRAGAVGTAVPLTLELLADGDHMLAVAGQAMQACGDIPQAGAVTGAPGQLPRTGDSTLGLAAALAGGVGALLLALGLRMRSISLSAVRVRR